jgi:hypothetical protein
VPWARSRRSTSATVSPRVAASRAMPAPVTPPPTTRRSTTSPAASSSSSRSRRARLQRGGSHEGLRWRSGAGRGRGRARARRARVEAVLGLGDAGGDDEGLDDQEGAERDAGRVARDGSSRRPALGDQPGDRVEDRALRRAEPPHEVGHEQLRVEVEDALDQRVGGDPRREVAGAGDQPGTGVGRRGPTPRPPRPPRRSAAAAAGASAGRPWPGSRRRSACRASSATSRPGGRSRPSWCA